MTARRRLLFALFGLVVTTAARAAHGQGSITGMVRDSAGNSIVGAAVSIERIPARATSSATGAFTLRGLPAGLHLVQVRAFGFVPAVATTFLAGETKHLEFVITRVPQSLDTVVVKGRTRIAGIGLTAFDERRALGFGKFIGAEELRQNEHRKVSDMLASIPGVLLVKPKPCRTQQRPDEKCDSNPNKRIAMRGRGQPCAMQVVLDGAIVFRGDGRPVRDAEFDWEGAWDLTSTSVSELAGVEVYRSAAEVPTEYGGAAAGCGVILLWTRR